MRKTRRSADPTPEGAPLPDGEESAPRSRRRRKRSVSRWVGRRMGADGIRAGYDSSRAAYETAFADEKTDGVNETFAESVRRQGLREADILAAGQRQQITAIANAVLLIGLGLAAIWSLLKGLVTADGWSLFWGAAALCISSVLAALFLKASFRLWQIRERRLGSFQEFLRIPREWVPRAAQPRAPGTGLAVAGGAQRPATHPARGSTGEVQRGASGGHRPRPHGGGQTRSGPLPGPQRSAPPRSGSNRSGG